MNFRKGHGREDPEINLIPFIDVLLVILIFLMITTTYSKFTELQITLPTADAEKALDKPNEILVGVDAKGQYSVNRNPVSFRDVAGLAEDLKQAVNNLSNNTVDNTVANTVATPKPKGSGIAVVVINADQLATHQMVVNVMEAARLAGLEKLTFAAQASVK
jgi:biopolymer transport protein ExbD